MSTVLLERMRLCVLLLAACSAADGLQARRCCPRRPWSFASRASYARALSAVLGPRPMQLSDWLSESSTEIVLSEAPSHPNTVEQAAAFASALWQGLLDSGKLSYLDAADQLRIKGAVVSLTLFTVVNSMQAKGVAGYAQLKKSLQSADKNADGEISLVEFRDWFDDMTVLERELASATSLSSIDWGALEEEEGGPDGAAQTRGPRFPPAQEAPWGEGGESKRGGQEWDAPRAQISHALEMVEILLDMHVDAETVVAGLARDIARGTDPIDLGPLDEEFGLVSAQIVRESLRVPKIYESQDFGETGALLRRQAASTVRPLADWSDENAKLIRTHVLRSVKDARAVLIHTADLLVGLRRATEPGSDGDIATAQTRGLEALQLMLPLSTALLSAGGSPRGKKAAVLRELELRSYSTLVPHSFGKISEWHEQHYGSKSNGAAVVTLAKTALLERLRLSKRLHGRIARVQVEHRTKDLVSVFRKVFRQHKEISELYDMIGMRVIVFPLSRRKRFLQGFDNNVDGPIIDLSADGLLSERAQSKRVGEAALLQDVYEEVCGLWNEIPGRFKDYVNDPKPNGYQSLHTTVLLNSSWHMEVQIRSMAMHVHAEGGAAAHGLYKGGLESASKEDVKRFGGYLKGSVD